MFRSSNQATGTRARPRPLALRTRTRLWLRVGCQWVVREAMRVRTLATDPLQELIVSLRRKERFDRFPAADSEKRIHRDHLLLLLALDCFIDGGAFFFFLQKVNALWEFSSSC